MRTLCMIVCVSLVAVSLFLFGVTRAEEDAGPARAKRNYHDFCAKCHGENGKGDGSAAATLNPRPRDYTDCKVMQGKKDDELIKVITDGGEAIGMSADMQPWGGTLSADEIKELLTFVRGFCKQS